MTRLHATLLMAACSVAFTAEPTRNLCLAKMPARVVRDGKTKTKPTTAFRLTLDPAVQKTRYTGRVYVVVSTNLEREPRLSINSWFRPPQVLSLDVSNVAPGAPITVGRGALQNPGLLSELPAGDYQVQAVARRSLVHPVPGRGEGDLYSEPRVVSLDPAAPTTITLKLTKVAQARPFEETDRVKLVEIVSPSLSSFHGREMKIRAGVILPEGWKDDPSTTYPVLYRIGGFGGSHHSARFMVPGARRRRGRPGRGDDPSAKLAAKVLTVVPDPQCYRGHNVFADSDNNGPWGKALIEELIPAVEKKFHGARSGRHRYVTGGSSGGWSSLWLQITYPDAFNGCWSHVPDPVDFRDFQQINLYKPGTNMYRDEDENPRPLARRNGEVTLLYEDFVSAETVLGPGGQIHSFEAVFSRRRPDGTPASLFDRKTGAIDASVAESWRRYDIRLVLEENWEELAPKLSGKMHIYAGEKDTFYLEGAVRLLKESLTKLGSDADVRVIPGMGHGTFREAVVPMYETILNNFRKEFGTPTGE